MGNRRLMGSKPEDAVVLPLPVHESPPSDDEALVRRARAGDRSAFGALHGRYSRLVHGLLLARVQPEIADDLVQDVFLVAMQRLGSLDDDNAFGAWLCRIARNLAVDHHRTARRNDPLPAVEAGEAPPPTAEARQVLHAIRDLPEAYAETLILRLVEGMTGPEIAARTGLTPGSVRVNLHRGMKLLRSRLGEEAP